MHAMWWNPRSNFILGYVHGAELHLQPLFPPLKFIVQLTRLTSCKLLQLLKKENWAAALVTVRVGVMGCIQTFKSSERTVLILFPSPPGLVWEGRGETATASFFFAKLGTAQFQFGKQGRGFAQFPLPPSPPRLSAGVGILLPLLLYWRAEVRIAKPRGWELETGKISPLVHMSMGFKSHVCCPPGWHTCWLKIWTARIED